MNKWILWYTESTTQLQNANDVDFCKHYIFHSVDSFHWEIGNNNGIWRKSTLILCNTSYYRLKVFKQLFADKNKTKLIGFSAYFRLWQFFEISIQMPHLLHYSCVSLSVNFSHTLFVIPTMLHTKIQSHCDTV